MSDATKLSEKEVNVELLFGATWSSNVMVVTSFPWPCIKMHGLFSGI